MPFSPHIGDREQDKFYNDGLGNTTVRVGINNINGFLLDAFGRLRVSTPETIFDSKQLHDNAPLFWDDQETSGSGTSSTYSTAKASSLMAVSATTAGTRIRQTFRRFNYQPGKSQLIFLTGTFGLGASGIEKSVGMFDASNGLFFQYKDGVMNVVRRSSYSGSPVDTTVAQSAWSDDTFDGNGGSGITLDFTKSQIMFIDFEWLGVGSVRMGFVVNGKPIVCHRFHNANLNAGVYMSTPNLPLRYLITNDGTGAASDLEHICATVISEGGADARGLIQHAGTENTGVTLVTGGTIYALFGMKLKSTHLDSTILPIAVSILCTSSDNIHWELIFNPTVAGTFTYSNLANSSIQTAVGASTNTVTGGTPLGGGYLASGSGGANAAASGSSDIVNELVLGSAIDGTADEVVLCAMPIGAGTINAVVYGDMTFREQT